MTNINPLIPNRIYDWLKWIAIIVLPATSTLLIAVGNIWNIGILTPISATVTAIAALMGTILGISAISYNKPK